MEDKIEETQENLDAQHQLLQSKEIADNVKNLETPLEGMLLKSEEISKKTDEGNESLKTIAENTKPKEVQKIESDKLDAIAENTKPKEVQKIELVNDDKELAGKFFSLLRGEKGDKGEKGEKGDKGDKPNESDLINIIKPLIPEPKNGKDGIDGKDGKDGKDGSPDTPKQVKEKLLKVGLDYEELNGLPDIPKIVSIYSKTSSRDYNLTELKDVSISSPTNNQVLKYNSTTRLWENGAGGGSSPLTTKGDLYTFSTVDARLPVGTNGQVLSADSSTATGLKWVALAGGGDMLQSTYDPAGIAQQLVGLTASQTLTNKTLTSPTINAGTFGTSITASYATASTVPYFDASKNLISSAVTPTELGYLSGVTSSIQTQLNAKGSGTVTTVSVASANGFAGTVANATTTPAITLTTTITGILKGNGTAISAASAGTDYVAPGAITSSGLTMATAKILGRATVGTGAIEEISVTGSGSVVLATSPTLVTPVLGVASGTSLTLSSLTAGRVTFAGTSGLLSDDSTFLWDNTNKALNIGGGTASFTLGDNNLFNIIKSYAGYLASNIQNLHSGTTSSADLVFCNDDTTSTTNYGDIGRGHADPAYTLVGAGDLYMYNQSQNLVFFTATAAKEIIFGVGGQTSNKEVARITATGLTLGLAGTLTGQLSIKGSTSGTAILTVPAVAGTPTLTLPTSTDTLVGRATTDTLTNKTLTSPTLDTLPIFSAGANVKYTVPTSDGTATGEITNEFNSGYSSTAVGDLVYLDSSGTWQKADADLSTAAYSSMLGIALEVKSSGQAVKVLLRGYIYAITPFPTFTIGAPVYMSTTAGAVTQTAPTGTDSATRIVGYAIHADKMYFNPENDFITHT